jgi:hypothetical protein
VYPGRSPPLFLGVFDAAIFVRSGYKIGVQVIPVFRPSLRNLLRLQATASVRGCFRSAFGAL